MSGRKAQAKSPKVSEAEMVRMALELGAIGAKVVSPANVATGHWVRWKCQFGCGGWGRSLVCPPHTPAPEATRKMLDEFRRAVLFESPGGQAKKVAAALERKLFLSGFYKAFGLGAGPCHLCQTCAFEKGCRHPRDARPCMEACGIDVYATARRHGFTIEVVRTHQDPQHYYGMVLVD